MNKKNVISVVILLLIVMIIIVGIIIATTKQLVLMTDGKEIDLKYSSIKFKDIQKSDAEKILESENEEIQIKINDNLKDAYESYNILKDYRMMAYNGQEAEYNKTSCFYYFDSVEDRYTVIAQINEESYLEIYIKPKENSSRNAEETFNQKKVQKILNTLEIKS